jgi:hypothetical protein
LSYVLHFEPYITKSEVRLEMRRSPKKLKIACNHSGLTHYGGVHFFHEFTRVLQMRDFIARHLDYPRRNHRYSLSQMLLALVYPIILGLDRLETASFLQANGTFQYLTGLPSFPDAQTRRRFLLQAPPNFRQQLHRINHRLLQEFIHRPQRRSRLILDLDSTVLTVFGHQEGTAVGYNPRYRGKRSYSPLICLEANSAFLWDAELRAGNAPTWSGGDELLASCFSDLPEGTREVRVRADAGFGYAPVLNILEQQNTQYAVVARLTPTCQRRLPGLHYEPVNRRWELGEMEYQALGWPQPRRLVVARRPLEDNDPHPSLLLLERYLYRGWLTNLSLTPAGVWHYYDGRAVMEPRIAELREDFALRKIPTASFAANALFLEIIRLAYNLVVAFQTTCLPEAWNDHTLHTLRYKLFWLPGELTRPQNRPVLRLLQSATVSKLTEHILNHVGKLKPL